MLNGSRMGKFYKNKPFDRKKLGKIKKNSGPISEMQTMVPGYGLAEIPDKTQYSLDDMLGGKIRSNSPTISKIHTGWQIVQQQTLPCAKLPSVHPNDEQWMGNNLATWNPAFSGAIVAKN